MDEENKSPANVPEKVKEINANSASVASDDNPVAQNGNSSSGLCGSHNEINNISEHMGSEGPSSDLLNKVAASLKTVDLAENVSDHKVETSKDTKMDGKPHVQKERSGPEPIIIPLVLKMAEFDHKALLEEWISTRTFGDKCLDQDKSTLMTNLKTIQDYLCSFKSQGLSVVNVSATTFPQTLDWLHGYLLQCIEQGISSTSSESGRQPAEG
ncbi:uncharacterized protein LOC110810078 [Carica papaya]|uniref:uncharacterized protein LOC110810078 n=1 Tax=Carica papaya TaxID=3649 RepID=UPI000B8CDD2F|nr:uncharacterized protein LOC110810078 [Carica papaya]